MDDKLTYEKARLADSFNSDPDRDVFGMSDKDYAVAYDTSDDIEKQYLDEILIIDTELQALNDKIYQLKHNYHGEYQEATTYFEDKYGTDPDDTYISMGDYKDFKRAYGDQFKTNETYDQKVINELNTHIINLKKARNHVCACLDSYRALINKGIKR